MAEITDTFMREMLSKSKAYSVVILKAGPSYTAAGADAIIWEHARRNFSLRADGVLPIVCPVTDDSELSGIAIFDRGVDEIRAVMDDDPGVRANLFTYEVHPCRSFPGDALPG